MIGNKDYIGVAADCRYLDLVSIRISGKKIRVLDYNHLEMIVPFHEGKESVESKPAGMAAGGKDDIFGLEESPGEAGHAEPEELSFEELGDLTGLVEDPEETTEMDLVDEADDLDSNELLLYNHLLSVKKRKKHNIGLNIRSGSAVFQYVQGSGYASARKKEIRDLVENKLHSVHGEIPGKDRYSYYIREDGKLVIASVDKEPVALDLVNKVYRFSGRNHLYVRDIIPDEAALTGLYRLNYPLQDGDEKITGLVQFREKRCRIIFLKGHQVLQISPLINEGTADKGFLNTVFSKILFQLDTGEVPGLDRIVLCDNSLGEEAVLFFKNNFPELDVTEFQLQPDLFEIEEQGLSALREYTTALAVALAASGAATELYPKLSIIPGYIEERQKVFKLHWHGIFLLIAIGLSPVVLNHFYQQSVAAIESLRVENSRYDHLMTELEPTVREVGLLEERLASYQEQLLLLNEISEENIRWTASFDHINHAVQQVGGLWITTFVEAEEWLNVEGIALNESRIPAFARQFANVTLRSVQQSEMRDRTIYLFSMRINNIVTDESLYTPEESRSIMNFLETSY